MTRGLVFGKFHPPHRGHKFLIDHARERCDTLTVLLMASSREWISGEQRLAWMREMLPETDVRLVPDEMPQSWTIDRDDLWHEFTALVRAHHPEPIDVLFTSEWYGEATAQWLGCRHVAIEPMRTSVPISATQIRENPSRYLDRTPPGVRAWLVPRIILIGAESTGKTTLARELATHYTAPWVPEFGRAYSEWIGQTEIGGYPWTTEDFVVIADEQQRREDAAARDAMPILVCDTDAFATDIWQQRYLGSSRGMRPTDLPGRRFYLLTENDLPFVADGTRDGEAVRDDMTMWFTDALERYDVPFARISGHGDARLRAAVDAVERARSTPIPLER